MSGPDRLRGGRDTSSVASAETSRLGEFGCVVCGEVMKTSNLMEVRSPYDNSLLAVVHRAGPREIERAIAGAVGAFKVTRKLPSWKRAEILEKISSGIGARLEEFAQLIALEAGKPIRTARIEAGREQFKARVRRDYGLELNQGPFGVEQDQGWRTIATTTQCYDPRRQDWAWSILKALGIPEHLFQPVIEPGTVIDGLTLPPAEIERRLKDVAGRQIHPEGVVRSAVPV